MKGGGEFVNYYLKLIMLFLSVAVIVTAIILCCVTESQITDRSATYKKYADGYDSSQYIYTCCTNCQTSTANNYEKYKDPDTKETEKYYLWIDQYVIEETKDGYRWKLSTTTSPCYANITDKNTQKVTQIPVYTCSKTAKDKKGIDYCADGKSAVTDIVVIRTIYQSRQISAFDGSTGENQLKLYDECFPNAPSPSYIGDTYETPVAFTDKDGKTTEYSKYNDWLLVNYCDKDSQTKFCEESKRQPSIPLTDKIQSPKTQGIDEKYGKIIVYQSNLTPEIITLDQCNPKWDTMDPETIYIRKAKYDTPNGYGITSNVKNTWTEEYRGEEIEDKDTSYEGTNVKGEKSEDGTWSFYIKEQKCSCSKSTENGKDVYICNTCANDDLCDPEKTSTYKEYKEFGTFNWSSHEVQDSACGRIN